jgi:protein-tyrosine-phosphatase
MPSILFACVANSARSQLAEAIARHVAPAEFEIWSAGSRASNVKPEVRTVLDELGIDSRGLLSKGFHAVPLDEMDAAVTLCQDEVCPVFPGTPARHHWPLPDPDAAWGEARLEAFRAARDELLRRIPVLLSSLGA